MATAIVRDRLAGDEFHHEVGQAVRLRAAVQQSRNVRMIERSQNLPLAQESVAREVRVHPALADLARDLLMEMLVVTRGFVDGAHPAASDEARDAVSPDALSGQIVFWFGGE